MSWIGFGVIAYESKKKPPLENNLNENVLESYTNLNLGIFPATGITSENIIQSLVKVSSLKCESVNNISVRITSNVAPIRTNETSVEEENNQNKHNEYLAIADFYHHQDSTTSPSQTSKKTVKSKLKSAWGTLLGWISQDINLRGNHFKENSSLLLSSLSNIQRGDEPLSSRHISELMERCKESRVISTVPNIVAIYSQIQSSDNHQMSYSPSLISSSSTTTSSSSSSRVTSTATISHHHLHYHQFNQQSTISLPSELLLKVMQFLPADSLRHMSATCRMMRDLSLQVIPGLKLQLYPHQINSVYWMIQREENSKRYRHPLWRCLKLNSKSPTTKNSYIDKSTMNVDVITSNDDEHDDNGYLNCNVLTGDAIYTTSHNNSSINSTVPTIAGVCGGFLCDEPGLGKTITLLAVILRKLGTIATAADVTDTDNSSNDGDNYNINSTVRSIGDNGTNSNCSNNSKGSTATTTDYNLRHAGARKREANLHTALPSGTTLIVVPEVLRNQWRDQIDRHIHAFVLNNAHIFIDEDESRELPSSAVLASYAVIVTTHKRLALEWKNGRPLVYNDIRPHSYFDDFYGNNNNSSNNNSSNGGNINGSGSNKNRKTNTSDLAAHTHSSKRTSSSNSRSQRFAEAKAIYKESSLLGVIFYRIAFDEGHSLGRTHLSASLQMATCLMTKCRWILSGTPTPSDRNKALSYLQQQFKFLRHPLFVGGNNNNGSGSGSISHMGNNSINNIHSNNNNNLTATIIDGDTIWKKLYQPTFRPEYAQDAFYGPSALINLLSQNMIRHTKENILEIPKPVYFITPIQLSPSEAAIYNFFVSVAQANLVITDLDYTSPGKLHKDSLLNSSNREALSELMFNLRIVTCGAGRARLTLKHSAAVVAEIEVILKKYKCSDDTVQKIREYIHHTLDGEKTACEQCRVKLEMMLITPCGHIFCPTCMRISGDYCSVCEKSFNWSDLQRLQPGFSPSPFVFSNSVNTTAGGAINNTGVGDNIATGSSVSTLVSSSSTSSSSSFSGSNNSSSSSIHSPISINNSNNSNNTETETSSHIINNHNTATYINTNEMMSAKIDYLLYKITSLDTQWKQQQQQYGRDYYAHVPSTTTEVNHTVTDNSIINDDNGKASKKRRVNFSMGQDSDHYHSNNNHNSTTAEMDSNMSSSSSHFLPPATKKSTAVTSSSTSPTSIAATAAILSTRGSTMRKRSNIDDSMNDEDENDNDDDTTDSASESGDSNNNSYHHHSNVESISSTNNTTALSSRVLSNGILRQQHVERIDAVDRRSLESSKINNNSSNHRSNNSAHKQHHSISPTNHSVRSYSNSRISDSIHHNKSSITSHTRHHTTNNNAYSTNSSSNTITNSTIDNNYTPKVVVFSEFPSFLLRLSIEFNERGVAYSYLAPGGGARNNHVHNAVNNNIGIGNNGNGNNNINGNNNNNNVVIGGNNNGNNANVNNNYNNGVNGSRGRGRGGVGSSSSSMSSVSTKARELMRFKTLPSVRVLLLSSEGSHGLDLSFVTHIYLMNAVMDASLEQQVISRAYRMGATRAVAVEQIYTRDTVEEQLYHMKDEHQYSSMSTGGSNNSSSSVTFTKASKSKKGRKRKNNETEDNDIDDNDKNINTETCECQQINNTSSTSSSSSNARNTKAKICNDCISRRKNTQMKKAVAVQEVEPVDSTVTSKYHRLMTSVKLLPTGLEFQANSYSAVL